MNPHPLTRLASVTLLSALGACRRVPANLRPTLDRHLPQIEALAVAAAARCPEVRNIGIAAVIRGTVPESPAVNTPLGTDPEVLQVTTTCLWPIAGGGGGVGNSYLPLHPEGERRSGTEQTYVLSGHEADHTRELVTTPAIQVNDPAAFDVEVNRPGPGGSWLHLVVTLKPGASVLLPRASNHPVNPR